ncbi:MAG TPA: LysM peptidoglycan-binding domain-containing protein [Anaerolineales bacterium]|nr:LysM peptidoglycan-binding domain-containing protein [Anaerolineales bacterium]
MRIAVAPGFPVLASVALILMTGCTTAGATPSAAYPTYNPFVQSNGASAGTGDPAVPAFISQVGPTPTLADLSVTVPTRASGAPLVTPTPDAPRSLPTPRQATTQHTVQPGDTLGAIAQNYGVSVAALLATNGLDAGDLLSLGTVLSIPAPELGTPGPSFKIIPDSELVYGPASAQFDVEAFVTSQGGFLAGYSEEIDTRVLSGSDIINLISRNYSVNPRLLLAVLEHQSKWVTESDPRRTNQDYPLGFVNPNRVGLYRQLAWAATELNRGYYLWRAGAVGTWVLNDGAVVPIDPTINAGTAGVQSFFSILDSREQWNQDTAAFGLFQTYFLMFGNPFDLAIEPIVPPGNIQPTLMLPFEPGVAWAFTGGPHAAWDSGSAWAALDFAPPDVMGCAVSQQWVTAAGDGFIVRASDGAVVQDLDGDGYEQTGWNLLYMHIFEQDRVRAGEYLRAGERIGHPSCEGGVSNAAHLHFARKYNGEWIPADGTIPFNLQGWISSGDGQEYNGFLTLGSRRLEAEEGASDVNIITR